MKFFIYILLFIVGIKGFPQTIKPDFTYGNCCYYNLNKGESLTFHDTEIKFLHSVNHFNLFLINNDSIWLKISRRTLPTTAAGVQIFVADNQNLKSLTQNKKIHGLLKKDVLIGVTASFEKLLDWNKFVFPVSFNDGFLWKLEENSHMFSYVSNNEKEEQKNYFHSHAGIDINLHDARGLEKHLLVAPENSTVVWIEDKNIDQEGTEACILLESDAQPGIYYIYNHLSNKKIFVKKGDKLVRGEAIGGIWGDRIWGHLSFAVVKSDSIPTYGNQYHNLINVFPQLYELYFQESLSYFRIFSKGRIHFGQRRNINGNEKNNLAYEPYSGKGWILGKWNIADKVEWYAAGTEGNVRLKKIMFENEPAECTNPENWFDFEINVKNGTYRIRANVGDIEKPSWQKISFEGITADSYHLPAGMQKWTSEKIVKVNDSKLTVRIFIDQNNQKVAGISEIVFQQVY